MDNFLKSFLYKHNVNDDFTAVQLEEIKYSILAISGDISKFIILIVFFGVLNYQVEFLYAFLTTTLLRIFSGGKHFNTYLQCLLFSFTYFTFLIFFSRFIAFKYDRYLFGLSIISLFILLLIAPQILIKSNRKYKMNICITKFILFILMTVYMYLFIIKKEPMYNIGLLAIIFQTIQLLLIKGENYYEIKKQKSTDTQYS